MIFTIVVSTLMTTAITIAIIGEQANILFEQYACMRDLLFVLMFQVTHSSFMIVITKLITFDDNTGIRKAVNKALLHLFAAYVMSFTISLLPCLSPSFYLHSIRCVGMGSSTSMQTVTLSYKVTRLENISNKGS